MRGSRHTFYSLFPWILAAIAFVVFIIFFSLLLFGCTMDYQDEPSLSAAVALKETPAEESEEDPPEEPMEDIMTVLPIAEYQKYASSAGQIFGIKEASLEKIDFKSQEGGTLKPVEFIVKNGTVYFSIQTFEVKTEGADPTEKMLYFSQKGDTLSEITKAQFPSIPERERVEYESGPFIVKKTSYGTMPNSTVTNQGTPSAFVCVDSAFANDSGLWFSSSERFVNEKGNGISYEGIYFWPADDPKHAPKRIKDVGRVW